VICDPAFQKSRLTLNGKSYQITEISLVINCLSYIDPSELFCFPEEERQYQAAEFHALLVYFLSSLSCPVFGRASTLSLAGPALNRVDWQHLAIAAGLPIISTNFENNQLDSIGQTDLKQFNLIIVGKILTTPSNTCADQYIKQLAQYLQLDYLEVNFCLGKGDKIFFKDATSKPSLQNPEVRRAILDYLN